MVPLGPLKTAHSEVMDPYKTIVDRYDGTVYPDMIVVALEGVTTYNSYINHTPPFKWIIHPNWYTTAGFRAKNRGMLGRSNGCVVVDPGRKQPARHAASGWSSGLRDGRRCPDRTIFVIRAFPLKVKLSWKCRVHESATNACQAAQQRECSQA
jgi:hypothetical protein